VVGTAPPGAPVNEPILVNNYLQAVETFKLNDDPSYTLNQAAKVLFQLYGVGPHVFINVFDPSVHSSVNDVTASDVVGGVDATTGKRKGLELIEEVWTRYGKIVGIITAPGFSHDSTVYNAMIAKAENLSGHFKAVAYIDAPPEAETLADLNDFKSNIGSPYAYVLAPPVKYGEETHYLSLHAAGLTAKVDYENSGVPYKSPSNKELRISEPTKIYTIDDANYLNSRGIATVFRFSTGWHLWGDRTAAFPENTDVKDTFLSCRRMVNWIENNLVVNTWQKVDDPMNKRNIESVVDTWNVGLGQLVGIGALLEAKVQFLEEDNPVTSLMNGKVIYRVNYTPVPPSETIEFVTVVDVSGYQNLFK
jgi:phage tail sheath protein FI